MLLVSIVFQTRVAGQKAPASCLLCLLCLLQYPGASPCVRSSGLALEEGARSDLHDDVRRSQHVERVAGGNNLLDRLLDVLEDLHG